VYSTQGVGLFEWDGRLGAAASLSFLNEALLALISGEVLVGWKLWQHERLAREGEATMLLSV